MYAKINRNMSILKILCFLCCSSVLVINLSARELEIYLGPSTLDARKSMSIPYTTATTIEALQAAEMKSHLSELREKFSQAGGYDLIGAATYVRWAWLSSDSKSWVMQVPLSSKGSIDIEKTFSRSEWKREADKVFRSGNLIMSIQKEKVYIGSKISADDLLKESKYWSIPSCRWFQIKAYKPLFQELAKRRPRLEALLSYVDEINWSLSGGDLTMDIQLTEGEKATSLAVSANAAVQLIKNLIINQDSYVSEPWQLLDFLSYNQASINSKSVELIFERLRFRSFGKVFQASYVGVGDFGQFLTDSLPKMTVSLALSVIPQYSKHRDRLGQLITAGVGKSRKDRQEVITSDSCDSEIKMIRQAIEFYNLDHLQQKNYYQIKPKLFEEGYLPSDLSCDGKLVIDNTMFYMNSDGLLVRKRASQ